MSTQPQALNSLLPLDANGNPINPYGQAPGSFGYVPPSMIPQSPGAGNFQPATDVYGNPVAAPQFNGTRDDSIGAQVNSNQNLINEFGQQINQEAESQLGYYSPLQAQYQQEANSALNQLGQTPGYTPQEAGQININYSQDNTTPAALQAQFLSPNEQQWIAGDPSVGSQVTDQGIANEGAQLNSYGQDLSGQVGNYANYTKAGTDLLGSGLSSAQQQLNSGLQGAQSGFSSLNEAVNNPSLSFDPNNTEKQITDAQMQEMQTAAGQRIGAQYQTAEDQLQRQAAAAGNSSPLAIAAANSRLQTQEASDQGNAEVTAQLAALQAQQQQATSIEQQREAATQAQTGFKAGAATTEQQQAQNAAALAGTSALGAAGLAGTQEIAAGESVGQAGINAANQYGQQAIGEQNTMTGQQYGADTTAEQLAQQRAAQIAGNRQTTQQNVNQTQYSQGTGSQQLTSAGAQTVGGARMAGQNTYLQGVTGQQSGAQQGGQAAVGQQQSAYSTQTGGLNQGTASLGNYKVSAPTAVGQATGLINALGSKAKGDVITQPSLQVIGEAGPEMVMKVPQYPRYRRAA